MPTLQRERRDDGIEIVRLDRPEVRNALNSQAIAELVAVLAELAADEGLRVLVLSTTSTRAFCAGADVGEELDREGGVARMEAFAALYAALDAFPAPVVCVCVGNCVGAGAELVAGSDLRVGGDNLKLAWAGARLGAPVGPARLAPLIGVARAKELVYTSRVVGMEEAVALGLLNRTAPAARAEAAALELAARDRRVSARRAAAAEGDVPRPRRRRPARVAHENELLDRVPAPGRRAPAGCS